MVSLVLTSWRVANAFGVLSYVLACEIASCFGAVLAIRSGKAVQEKAALAGALGGIIGLCSFWLVRTTFDVDSAWTNLTYSELAIIVPWLAMLFLFGGVVGGTIGLVFGTVRSDAESARRSKIAKASAELRDQEARQSLAQIASRVREECSAKK